MPPKGGTKAEAKNRRPHPSPSAAVPNGTASAPKTKTPDEAIDSALSSQFSPENTVTLLVGPNEQKMIAYGSQLTHESEFFKAALKKEWAEGQTRIIKLPEESPAVMAHYLSYLYSGKMFTEDIKSVPGASIGQCFDLLASLYVACERFLNTKAQATILAEILRLACTEDEDDMQWTPAAKSVAIIYGGTPDGSPARRLLVDLHVACGESYWMSFTKLSLIHI